MRKRTRKQVLELLVVLLTLISGTKAVDDVVAEADEMAKEIEEESKKVDAQTNAMVSEIEAKGKTVEDAHQEKRFQEASNHVDDIMDKHEKAVDDKDKIAEDLQNEADSKVEELGRKVEENSSSGNTDMSKKRSAPVIMGLGTKMSIPGLIRHSTISYTVEMPPETSVGEEIEKALKEGEQMKNFSEDLFKTQKYGKHGGNGELEDATESFYNPQSFSETQDSGNEEIGNYVAVKQGKPMDSSSESQYSINTQESGNEVTGKFVKQGELTENTSEESKDVDANDSIGDTYASSVFYDDNNQKHKSDMYVATEDKQPSTEENKKDADYMKHEGAIIDVDVYQETNKTKEKDYKESDQEDILGDMEEQDNSTLISQTPSQNHDNNTETKHKSDMSVATEDKQPSTEENKKDADDMKHEGAIIDVDVYQETNKTKEKNYKESDQEDILGDMAEQDNSTLISQTPSQNHDDNNTETEQNATEKQSKTPGVEDKGPSLQVNFTPEAKVMKTDADDMKHEGAIIDVDVYQETNKTKEKNYKESDQEDILGDMAEQDNSTFISQTPSQNHDNNTEKEQKAAEKQSKTPGVEDKEPVQVNFTPEAKVIKSDQKILNEIEEDYALRKKENEEEKSDKELDKIGATGLIKEFDARRHQMSSTNDPEMLLRWPSLGKVIGKIGANQKVSMISPGEVDFLQTEYPDFMPHGSKGHKSEVIVRDVVGGEKGNVAKGSRKQSYLRKIFVKK